MDGMLTSFFVRFVANITKREFEELKKIAIRVESVDYEENKYKRDTTYILIGRHWVALVRRTIEDIIDVERVLFPCETGVDQSCIEPSDDISKEDLLDNSSYIIMFDADECIDIDLHEVNYSTVSNEAWLKYKCVKESYVALFNITIDPRYTSHHDQFILQLIAKYFKVFNDMPSMFRPM
jgi:hypothetical protein